MNSLRLTVLVGLVVTLAAMAGGFTESVAAQKEGRVLRHIVMYKFKDDCTSQQVQKVIDTFAGLPKQIDTIVAFEHGLNVSQEGKSDGLTHCFQVTFRDEAGLQKYLKHPAHEAYVKVSGPCKEKVVVFDYWTAVKE